MQATTCFHDSIANAILQEANFVFHDPVAFHPTNGVFHTDSDGRNTTIVGFLRRREFTPTGVFLGLDMVTPARRIPGIPYLIQTTARGQPIAR